MAHWVQFNREKGKDKSQYLHIGKEAFNKKGESLIFKLTNRMPIGFVFGKIE